LDETNIEVKDINGQVVAPANYDLSYYETIGGRQIIVGVGSYTVLEADVGADIKIVAVAKDGTVYTGQAIHSYVPNQDIPVVPTPTMEPTASPTLEPSATPTATPRPINAHYKGDLPLKEGDTLDAANVTVIGPDYEILSPNDYTIQFMVGGQPVDDGYVLKPNDVGKKVEFTVVAKADSGYTGAVTKPLGTVWDAAGNTPTPKPTVLPGEPTETPIPLQDINYGGDLPATVGQVLDKGDVTVIDKDGNIVPPNDYVLNFVIGGKEKGANYKLSSEDLGKTIDVEAVAVDGSGYIGTVTRPMAMVAAQNEVTITFNDDGNIIEVKVIVGDQIGGKMPDDPSKSGKTFTGWNTKPDGTGDWVTADTVALNDTTAYAIYAPELIKDDHFAYMQGYPGGYFAPEGIMTRAEVAVMFSRLILKNGAIPQARGIFPDVPINAWYANAIEYLVNQGILTGRDSTWFDPSAPITRAEFAAIASRFDKLSKVTGHFADVSSDYWAYDAINSAAAKGWVTGYPDGTFKPMNNIKRAEVVAVVNRMLGRSFDTNFDQSQLILFSDVINSYWGYNDIMEATNSHDYIMNDGVEKWLDIKNEKVNW